MAKYDMEIDNVLFDSLHKSVSSRNTIYNPNF